MKRTLLSLFGALLLFNCVAQAQNKSTKPIQTLHILFVAPDSFDALWNEAEVVAHVRILGSRPQATSDGRFVHTVHRARVIDVFKSDVSADCASQAPEIANCAPTAGHDLTLLQKAGEVETEHTILRLADEVPLKPGTEYILFLRWDAHLKAFLPFYGPDATFEIGNGVVHPTGRADVSRQHDGKSVAAFKAELRRRSDQR